MPTSGHEWWCWPALGGFVARGILLFTLLLPSMLAAVDHHGSERIPRHSHVSLDIQAPGEPFALGHVHGFERAHLHAMIPNVATEISLVSSALPATDIFRATGPLAMSFLPLALDDLSRGPGPARAGSLAPSQVGLPDEIVVAPPLQPPPPAAAR